MRTILLVYFLTANLLGYSQSDTTYFYGVNGKALSDKNDAKKTTSVEKISDTLYKMIHFNKVDEDWKKNSEQMVSVLDEGVFKIWTDGKENEDTFYRQVKDTNDHYLVVDYFPDNSVRQYGISKYPFPLHKIGTWISYYNNGQKKSIDTYINNQLTSNKRWDESGNEDISNVFPEAEIMPKYGKKGLNDFRIRVLRSMEYPVEAQERGIQGEVFLEFVVMENGEVEGLKVIKGAHPILDKEAYSLIKKMPSKWTPGYINDTPVRVVFTFPIVYILQ